MTDCLVALTNNFFIPHIPCYVRKNDFKEMCAREKLSHYIVDSINNFFFIRSSFNYYASSISREYKCVACSKKMFKL